MKVEFIAKAVKILAKYTFGIYLMHWYIQQIVVRLFDINTKLTVYRLLGPFLIIAIAVIVIWGIRKIPVVRKILP